jgi:hypothetical protein
MLRLLFGHFNAGNQWVALILPISWLRPPRHIIATNFAKTLATKQSANSLENAPFAIRALIRALQCGISMGCSYFANWLHGSIFAKHKQPNTPRTLKETNILQNGHLFAALQCGNILHKKMAILVTENFP